jgi:hypothetical protein
MNADKTMRSACGAGWHPARRLGVGAKNGPINNRPAGWQRWQPAPQADAVCFALLYLRLSAFIGGQ